MEEVQVQSCRSRLQATLLQGGSAQCFDGKNRRVLNAGRAVQPLIHTVPAPGLLGLFQPLLRRVAPKFIQLEIYAGRAFEIGEKPISEHLYKGAEIAAAIEEFLQG